MPETFSFEEAQPAPPPGPLSFKTEKDLARNVQSLTPEEQVWGEDKSAHDDELKREIARAKNPKILATLKQEQERRAAMPRSTGESFSFEDVAPKQADMPKGGFFQDLKKGLEGFDLKNNAIIRLGSTLQERAEIQESITAGDAYKAEQAKREKEGKRSDRIAMGDWVQQQVDQEYVKRHPSPHEEDVPLGTMLKQVATAIYANPGRALGEVIKGVGEDPEMLLPFNWEVGLAKAASRLGTAAKAIARTAEVGGEAAAIQAPISAIQQYQETGDVNASKVGKEAAVAATLTAGIHATMKLVGNAVSAKTGKEFTSENESEAVAKVQGKVDAGQDLGKALDDVMRDMGVPEKDAAQIVEAAKPHLEGEKRATHEEGKEDQAGNVEDLRGKEGQAGVLREHQQGEDKGSGGKEEKTERISKLESDARRIITGMDELPGEKKYDRLREIAGELRTLQSQAGKIDRRLLNAMGLVGLGSVGGLLFEQDPKGAMEGALLAGGVLAGGALLAKAGRSLGTIYDKVAADKRYRIDHLTEPYFGNIASGELASMRFSEMVKTMVNDPKRREAITHAIQDGDYKGLSAAERSAAETIRRGFDTMGELGQRHGILPDDLLQNYITQLWVPGLNSKDSLISNLKRAMDQNVGLSPGRSPKSRFGLQRTIPNYKAGIAAGMVPVTLDAAEIFRIYANNINRAIQNKKLLDALKNERNPAGQKMVIADRPGKIERTAAEEAGAVAEDIGLPVAGKEMVEQTSRARAPREYKFINHPQLRNVKVHPDIEAPLKALFEAHDPNAATRAALAVSVAAKRGLFSFSLFHAKSLLDAMLGTSPSGWKHVPGALKALKQGKTGDVVDQLVRGGLRIVDKPLEADATAFSHALKLLEQRNPTIALPAKGIRWMQEHMDKFLWGVVHPSFKLASAMAAYEKGLRTRPKVPPEQVAKDVASFVNDTFGGIDWYRIADGVQNKYGRNIALAMASPSGRRFMQIAMLAPDWTVATTRAMAKAIPGVSSKEIGAMHRAYVLRSAILYLAVGDGLNMAFSGHHLWQNEDPTMVDLGDGRKMQLSKHFMEPIHWLTKFGDQAWNKLGYLPKEGMEQILGKDYISSKGSPPMDTSVTGRVKHAVGGALPIPIQVLKQSPEAAVSGALGVPIYGKTEEQAVDAAVERALKAGKSATQAEKRTRSSYAKKRREQEARNNP